MVGGILRSEAYCLTDRDGGIPELQHPPVLSAQANVVIGVDWTKNRRLLHFPHGFGVPTCTDEHIPKPKVVEAILRLVAHGCLELCNAFFKVSSLRTGIPQLVMVVGIFGFERDRLAKLEDRWLEASIVHIEFAHREVWFGPLRSGFDGAAVLPECVEALSRVDIGIPEVDTLLGIILAFFIGFTNGAAVLNERFLNLTIRDQLVSILNLIIGDDGKRVIPITTFIA